MKLSDLEHILRASKEITGEGEFVLVGSQSLLGYKPDAPRILRVSLELDIYPRYNPDQAIYIEGSLGRYSMFDDTFGYHADGVGPETAIVPEGWEDRLVKFESENTNGAIAWCLSIYDLAYSKLAAGREKDFEFVANLLRYELIRPTHLERFLDRAEDEELRDLLALRFRITRRVQRELEEK